MGREGCYDAGDERRERKRGQHAVRHAEVQLAADDGERRRECSGGRDEPHPRPAGSADEEVGGRRWARHGRACHWPRRET